jgi:pimeloyl-ACP methyl ester carboxylesterase
MHFDDKGEGFPVLMGHGFLWDHGMWASQAGLLSSKFHCVCPDLWSHGESDPLAQDAFSLERLAQDHFDLMRALGIQKFAVVGHAVGGMWGMRLALSHPESVAALALVNTSAGSEPDAALLQYSGLLDRIEAAGAVPDSVAKALSALYFSDATLKDNPALSTGFTVSLSRLKAANLPGLTALGRAMFSRNSILSSLPQIACPVLVVSGGRDRFYPPSESGLISKSVPGAWSHVIPDAGHMTPLEAPLQVGGILKRFLSTLQPS